MTAGQTVEIVTEWNFSDGRTPRDWAVST